MSIRKFILCACMFLSIAGLQAQSPPDSADAMQSTGIGSPRGAMFRSAILPGWGQWYNNQKIKAGIAFCAETGLIANAVFLNQKVVASSTEDERLFYESNRSLSVWLAVGVYFLVIFDAYVDAHLSDFDISTDLSLTSDPETGPVPGVTLSWHL